MRFAAFRFATLATCFCLSAVGPARCLAADELDASHMPAATTAPKPATDLPPTMPGHEIKAKPAPVFPRPGIPSPAFTRPLIEPQVTNQTRQALSFYGGYSARTTLSQQPRRTPIQASAPRPLFRQAKPFQNLTSEPTVSPYLNLHRAESNNEGAPNYFAFVRPQVQQIEANRMQQRELQQLRGQLQATSTVVGPQYQSSGLPGTGTPARYMDTAQFYGGMRR